MSALLTIDRYHDHMDGGWGFGMAAMMLLVVIAVIVVAAWALRARPVGHSQAHRDTPAESPMRILDRRLAAGDIDLDEHKQRAAALDRSKSTDPPGRAHDAP